MDGYTLSVVAAMLAPLYGLIGFNIKVMLNHEKRLAKVEYQNEMILRYVRWLNGEYDKK